MVKKVKGLKVVSRDFMDKFKFTDEGRSFFGTSLTDIHSIKGAANTTSIQVDGSMTLDDRISDALFGVPQLAGVDTAELQHLVDNASDYEGFIIYLTTASTVAPFADDEKFYFCENASWHPSPFRSVDTAADGDGDGIPDSEDPFTVEAPSPGITHTVLNLTSFDFDNDPIFEQDDSGNILITAAPAGETNGNFEIDADGNIVLLA